jgi:hypothetical protein
MTLVPLASNLCALRRYLSIRATSFSLSRTIGGTVSPEPAAANSLRMAARASLNTSNSSAASSRANSCATFIAARRSALVIAMVNPFLFLLGR